jgi:hypothetical protein
MNIITEHLVAWLITVFITILTVFSDKIIERIRFGINKADLRIKYFEELATDLSRYIFWTDVYLERFEKNWTDDKDDLAGIAGELNTAMVTLREKEYVYKSWVTKYWTKAQQDAFFDIFDSVIKVDIATHLYNDPGSEKEKNKKLRDELELLQFKASNWLNKSVK